MIREAWTAERTALVGKMDAEGLSESEIGKAMGCSKHSVHWQRTKLGLVRKREPKAEAAWRSLSEKIRLGAFDFRGLGAPVDKGTRKPSHFDLDDPTRTDGKTIEQSTWGCRWPIGGEGADTRFCCRRNARGSYCVEHAKRAYEGRGVSKEDIRDLARMIGRAA